MRERSAELRVCALSELSVPVCACLCVCMVNFRRASISIVAGNSDGRSKARLVGRAFVRSFVGSYICLFVRSLLSVALSFS